MEDPSMMYPFAEPCFFSEAEYLVDSVTFPGASMSTNINSSSVVDKSSNAPSSYYLDYSLPDSHNNQHLSADVIDADAIFLSSSLDHTGASFIDSSLSSLSTPSPTNDAALYASLVSDDHSFAQHQDQFHMQQTQGEQMQYDGQNHHHHHHHHQQFVGDESQMEDTDVADSYLGKRTYLEHLSDSYCYGLTGDVIDTSPETLSSSAEFDPFVGFGPFDHSRPHASESFQLNTTSAPGDEDITASANQHEYHDQQHHYHHHHHHQQQQQQQQNDTYQSYADAHLASSSPGPVSTSDFYLGDEMNAEDSFPDTVCSDAQPYFPPSASYPFALHPDCSDCSQSQSHSHSHAHSHPHALPHAFPHPHQPLYALPASRPFLSHSAPHSHGQSYAVAMPQKQRRVASSVNAYAHFHQQQQQQHHFHQHQNFEYAPFSPDAYPFDACYNSCCAPNQHLQQQQQPHYFSYSAGAPERKKCRLDEEGNFVAYNGEGQVTQATSPYAQNRFMSSQQVLYSQGPVPQGPMMRGPAPTPSAAAIKRQQEQQQKQQKAANAKTRQTKPREKPAAQPKPRRTASTNSLPAAQTLSATGSSSPSGVSCASSVPVSVSQLASPTVLALSKSPLMLSPKMSPRKPAPLALPPSDGSSASSTKSSCLFIKPSPSPQQQQQQIPTPSSSASTSTTPSSSTASPCNLASPTPLVPILAPKAPEASSSPALHSPNENTSANNNNNNNNAAAASSGAGASAGGNVASTLAQIADLRSLLQKNIESSMLLALRDSFSRASKQTKDMLHQKESIYDSLPPAVNFFDQLSMQLLSSPVANNASPASTSTPSPSSSAAAPSATSVPKNVSYKVPISSPTMGANVSNGNTSNFHLPPAAIYSQVPRSIAPMYSVLNGPLPVGSPLLMPSSSGPMFSPPHALTLSPASQRPAQKTSPLSKSRSTSSVSSSSPLISATKLNFKPEPSFTTPLGSKPDGVTSPPLVSRSVFNPSLTTSSSSCGQSVILSGPRPSPAPMALNQPQGGKVPLQRA